MLLISSGVAEGLARGEDGVVRCSHRVDDPVWRAYHDEVFARPSADDGWVFEKVALEILASGLSFATTLARREGLRSAFAGFDLDALRGYGSDDVDAVMEDPAVIYHRRKVAALVANAARARELQDEVGSLAAFVWGYEAPPGERPERIDAAYLSAHTSTAGSAAMAAALKARGWTFLGPVTAYGVLKGVGVVNDHLTGCALRAVCLDQRAAFVPPVPA